MGPSDAAAFIKKHGSFLITAHTNLEGDALGSELAFFFLLKKLGKDALIVNEDGVPESYGFLPGIQFIRRFGKKMRVRFDAFVALDCSDLHRTGQVYTLNGSGRPTLNIDHHVSNRRFADVNWVDPEASSCSEMVYRLYKQMKVPFSRESALCLYTGLVTDTGSFRYINTTAFTHVAAAELIRTGVDVSRVYRTVYETIPYGDVRFLTSILPRMHREAGGKIIWLQLKRDDLKGRKLTLDLTEHILSFARAIKGVEVVVLFKENLGVKNEIRVNLRSRGKVDVNRIAATVGGGGHKTASGATAHGSIAGVRRQVVRAIKQALSTKEE